MRWLPKFERLLLSFGSVMLAIYLGALAHRTAFSRAALATFDQSPLSAEDQTRTVLSAARPDFSLWSPKRIKEYEQSLAAHFSPAIAILRIPKIQVEAPVFEETDELSLNRGVSRIAGTAMPGQNGNVGIAGHRDGFFRGLKYVSPGDTLEIITVNRTQTYVVDRLVIVNPEDTSVLGRRRNPSLTLVTCYPFYFVGSAPQRFIVQASIVGSDSGSSFATADKRQTKPEEQN